MSYLVANSEDRFSRDEAHCVFDRISISRRTRSTKRLVYRLSTFLIKVPGQSLTNFDQSPVYTSKWFKVFNCIFKISAGNSHNRLTLIALMSSVVLL